MITVKQGKVTTTVLKEKCAVLEAQIRARAPKKLIPKCKKAASKEVWQAHYAALVAIDDDEDVRLTASV